MRNICKSGIYKCAVELSNSNPVSMSNEGLTNVGLSNVALESVEFLVMD